MARPEFVYVSDQMPGIPRTWGGSELADILAAIDTAAEQRPHTRVR